MLYARVHDFNNHEILAMYHALDEAVNSIVSSHCVGECDSCTVTKPCHDLKRVRDRLELIIESGQGK